MDLDFYHQPPCNDSRCKPVGHNWPVTTFIGNITEDDVKKEVISLLNKRNVLSVRVWK